MSDIIYLGTEKKHKNGVAILRCVGREILQDGKVVARSQKPIRDKVDAHTFAVAVEESFSAAGYKVIWES